MQLGVLGSPFLQPVQSKVLVEVQGVMPMKAVIISYTIVIFIVRNLVLCGGLICEKEQTT